VLPYPDCIAQGVATVMASYSSWNGVPLHTSRYLLTDVLKGKLGFKVADRAPISDRYFDLIKRSLCLTA
jgi:hypothetical protein